MTPDSCRPVEVAVHGDRPMDDRDREAMGALVEAARAKMAAEHPHAGLIQELMAAWMSVRRQLPANDSRVGRDRNVAAVKQRMSDAIAAVREALERAS